MYADVTIKHRVNLVDSFIRMPDDEIEAVIREGPGWEPGDEAVMEVEIVRGVTVKATITIPWPWSNQAPGWDDEAIKDYLTGRLMEFIPEGFIQGEPEFDIQREVPRALT